MAGLLVHRALNDLRRAAAMMRRRPQTYRPVFLLFSLLLSGMGAPGSAQTSERNFPNTGPTENEEFR